MSKIVTALGAVVQSLSRIDSWQNLITGLGVAGRDKVMAGQPAAITPLSQPILEYLYHGDAIAGRIVDKIIEDATRQGSIIEAPGETDDAVKKRVEERWEELGAWQKLAEANRWGRLYGSGYVLLGASEAEVGSQLNLEQVNRIEFLTVLDAQEVFAQDIYSDPLKPDLGTPETYRVTPSASVSEYSVLSVHESRLIRFGGAPTSRRKRMENSYNDYSVLQAVYDALRRFDSDWRSASAMMADGSQGVLKIRGFADIISGNSKGVFETRMEIVNLCRTVARIMPIDAEDEEFQYVDRSWAGVADLLDKTTLYLAAAAGMPATVLFGRSPAGMDATGEGDRIGWYDTVQAHRKNVIYPRANELLAVICSSLGIDPEGWSITCPALLQESDADKAARQKMVADTDAVNIASEIVSPEEVALARFGSGEWSDAAPQIDVEATEKLAELDRERAKLGPASWEDPAALPPGEPQDEPGGEPLPVEGAEKQLEQAALAADPQAAYNGAQVASMVQIATAVVAGELPRETAIEILITAFPVDRPGAERIIGPAAEAAAEPKPVVSPAPFPDDDGPV